MAGAIYALTILQNINLNNLYGQHAVYQFYTLIGFGIGIFEMRYVLQKLPAYFLFFIILNLIKLFKNSQYKQTVKLIFIF